MITRDLDMITRDLDMIIAIVYSAVYDVTGADFENSLYSFGQSEKS